MLIALHQIIMNGETRRVLVNPQSIYVTSHDGTGSSVATIIGTIRVMETPEQIEELVSSKTQNHSNAVDSSREDEPKFDSAGFSIEDRMQGWDDYMANVDQDNQRYEDSHHCDDLDCNCSI